MGFSHNASADLHHLWVIQTSGRRFRESYSGLTYQPDTPVYEMNSSLTKYWEDGMGGLIPMWKEPKRGRLQHRGMNDKVGSNMKWKGHPSRGISWRQYKEPNLRYDSVSRASAASGVRTMLLCKQNSVNEVFNGQKHFNGIWEVSMMLWDINVTHVQKRSTERTVSLDIRNACIKHMRYLVGLFAVNNNV